MAKKKQQNKKSADIDLSSLAGDAGLVVLRDSDYATVANRIPLFIPNLDKRFGGGMPLGRMVEISGKPGGGKSTLSFHIARVASTLGCIVVLIDVEGTADRERLAELGIDINRILVKQPDEAKGIKLSVEEVGRTIETALELFKKKAPNTPIVFIWDSVGQTPSEVELGKEYGEQNVGARAKAVTQFVTKIAPQISESKSLLIGINQVRDDIGGNPMFQTQSVPGGNSWEHYASLRLQAVNAGQLKKTIDGKQERIGHNLKIKVTKSKVSRPHVEEDILLLSDEGIPYEANLVKLGETLKLIDSTPQSYEYIDLNGVSHKKKRDNFIEWLKSDPEGNLIRQELLSREIAIEFPNGYPALKNESLDITGWIDQIIPIDSPVVADEATSSDIDGELDDIINGSE